MTIYEKIENELKRAQKLHPLFPADLIHQVAIVSEESGEAMKAALDHYYFGKPIEDVKTELIQTAAVCVRVLKQLA